MTIKNRLGFRAAQYVLAAGIGAGALAIAAAPALANGKDSRTVDLHASVPPLCTMSDFSIGTLLRITVVDGLPVTEPESTETTVNCNVPSNVRLSSVAGGMIRTQGAGIAAAMTSFASRFDYVAVVKSGSTTFATLDTSVDNPIFNGAETTGIVPAFDESATTADMTITLEITPALPASGKTLMAGDYGDQLTLEILPQD